jgi:hypothetical protein
LFFLFLKSSINIDLDKQVAEKQQRSTREWEMKLERDKKYVRGNKFFFLLIF